MRMGKMGNDIIRLSGIVEKSYTLEAVLKRLWLQRRRHAVVMCQKRLKCNKERWVDVKSCTV